jgi:hypothetical protein
MAKKYAYRNGSLDIKLLEDLTQEAIISSIH